MKIDDDAPCLVNGAYHFLTYSAGAGGSSTPRLDRKAFDGRSHGWLREWTKGRPWLYLLPDNSCF